MKILSFTIAMLLASTPVFADDGVITSKSMSRNAKLTVDPEDIGLHVSEAEHAFIDMMKFYVPAQSASGEVLAVEYLDREEALVESLDVAKPLVGVFIYGPAVGVEGTPFAHSFMDTFGAISLDDGETWKATNLSESADLSSFTIDEGFVIDSAPVIEVDADTPTITENEYEEKRKGGVLHAKGKDAPRKAKVYVRNAYTLEVLGNDKASKSGEWEVEIKRIENAPCMIQAGVNDQWGPAVEVDGAPADCETGGTVVTDYPGGVSNVFHATAGNKVLVAWPSRYCSTGEAAYSFAYDGDNEGMEPAQVEKQEGLADFLSIDVESDLYLTDLFGVAGSQLSQNFADEEYPQAGEVPFRCVWTARGVLVPGDDPRTDGVTEETHMRWFKAERLTSGKRDPNRIEVKGVKGAGFAITWQEDPEGLRPGDGEGPGEGWSGAVAHHKTDVWYSFINWENFDLVEDPEDGYQDPILLMDYLIANTEKPQVGVPMAVPLRITNNAKCVAPIPTDPTDANYFSYCNYVVAEAYGLKDFCETTVDVETSKGKINTLCVTEDGLPLVANTASTRPRLGLKGFDSSDNGIDAIDDAWVVFAAEESKGLGAFFFYADDGAPCTEGDPARGEGNEAYLCEEADIGKNQWYYSFNMGDPDTSENLATYAEDSLVANVVSQGNLLNQPETDWRDGTFYPVLNTEDMWDFGTLNFDMYNTEIARRASLLMQGIGKAQASGNKLLVMSTWKQGAMNQGGPADMMLRRIVMPDIYDPSLDNPYAFSNMACDNWLVDAGVNPYYPGGICEDPATNLSAVVSDSCIDSTTGGAVDCPAVLDGIGDTNPILQGNDVEPNTTKVLTWHQCPSDGSAQDTSEVGGVLVSCENGDSNLADQSWYNPLDVSKGHRGFIDGDFVMILYAWSPNWRLNAKGSDRYELYVRRSFDGGNSWTTTPAALAGDGTVSCETYRDDATEASGDLEEPHVCYEFPAGGAEHARNITQHQAMRITTLDPRYAPTPASIEAGCVETDDLTIDDAVMTCDDLSSEHDSDLRRPDRYFMVFETGDNTTVTEGEAEPLDLFYGRAINYGDDYVVWAEETDLGVCYPNDAHGDDITDVRVGSGFCNEFDRMNTGGDSHSSEANLEANPDGSKLYGVWTQWAFDESGEEVIESDAEARRLWWIDDYFPGDAWESLVGGGTGN
ncbi:MAG: hypothetical protein KZQ85_16230 [Candidatus Thiodiazotropha sp. (ex Myrtea sp. 'scaly one' KF741663)]|nr:hypothetical protein [Candidatus Thiodiazotropha sp. (ex Myrtea sp. 'scaly one' KF741663)]